MKELEQAMYRIAYSAAEIGNPCQTPTVLDAGANPKFRPARKGASFGMTRPCSGKGKGYPEYVHERCSLIRPRIDPYFI